MLQRLSPLPIPDWLSDTLKARVNNWNTRLGQLQEAESKLRTLHNDVRTKPTSAAATKLQRDALEFVNAVEALIAEAKELRGQLREEWRQEKDRLRNQRDALVRARVEELADFLGVEKLPEVESDRVYVILVDAVALRPDVRQLENAIEEGARLTDSWQGLVFSLPYVEHELADLKQAVTPAVLAVNF